MNKPFSPLRNTAPCQKLQQEDDEEDDDEQQQQHEKEEGALHNHIMAIATSHRLFVDTEAKVESAKDEIVRIRQERFIQNQRREEMVTTMKHGLEMIHQALDVKNAELKEDMALHQYAKVLKDTKTPSYILILQAKVLRNLHHFCIMDCQLKLAEQQTEHLIAAMKEEKFELLLEQSKVQQEGMEIMLRLQMEDERLSNSFRQVMRQQNEEMLKLYDTLGFEDSFCEEELSIRRTAPQPQTFNEFLEKLEPQGTTHTSSAGQSVKSKALEEEEHLSSSFSLSALWSFTALKGNNAAA